MPQLVTVTDLTSKAFSPAERFNGIWSLNWQAVFDYGRSPWVEHGYAPAATVIYLPKAVAPPKGAWHIELLDTSDEEGALGYHENEAFDKGSTPGKASERSSRGLAAGRGTPLAKVFCKTARSDGADPWEVASHELIEMLVDPWVTDESEVRTASNPRDGLEYIVEACDAVQSTGYRITPEGPLMSNFCWPAWWGLEQTRKALDQQGRVHKPFEVLSGGYMSVKKPSGSWEQIGGAK